jgi:hypothetical protein
MKRFIVITAAMLTVLATRDAAAQVFINPFVDTTLTSPTGRGGASKAGFGAAFGNIGKIVGAETEVAYYPELMDTAANAIAKSKVVSFSGGMLIGPTLGRIKPYGAFGFGGLYLNVTSVSSILVPNPASFSNTYFTFNAGGAARSLTASRVSPSLFAAMGRLGKRLSTRRPTIWVISSSSDTESIFPVATLRPSRSTVKLSAISLTSSRKWLI